MWRAGEQVALEKPQPASNAAECVRMFGTPVMLLQAYYNRLDVKLVLLNGSRCAHVWQPDDWATRDRGAKTTVVLNVWSDHVSTYNSDVAPYAADKPTEEAPWADHLLATAKADDDAHRYDDMLPFDWSQLLEAWHEKRAEVFWTTAPLDKLLERGLHDHGLAFVPHYAGPNQFTFVDVPFCDGRHRSHIRIK